MAEISRTALFGKLNALGYKAVESATVFCKMRGNPYVELVHWIHQILQLPDSDLHQVIKAFNIDPSRLSADIINALDRLPRGSTSISDLSSHIEESIERGWIIATLMYGDSQVRTGYLLVGIFQIHSLKNTLCTISPEFSKVKLDTLTDRFQEIVESSPEVQMRPQDGFQVAGNIASSGTDGAMAPAAMGRQDALAQFTLDLTEQARNEELDPIVGRDEEIRQIVDILMRRRQNNPIITGEAGVGKTAVVEGFAQRIALGDVPPALRDVSLKALDVGLLQAGASMKGEFENRLKQVIEEVQSSERPIILFIDEAHTLIGAGGAAGTSDAANLLKPALARGNLRTIAATTWAEYKKHIEKDPALTRRFQVVQVFEPSEQNAMLMMRGMISTMEQHHQVQILDQALEASVKLSHRYIPSRQLPDKSVSLLDTAAARVAISQHDVPPDIDDIRKRIQSLDTEKNITIREQQMGIEVGSRLEQIEQALGEQQSVLTDLEQRWQQEQSLVENILKIRAQLRGDSTEAKDAELLAEGTSDNPVEQNVEPIDQAQALEQLNELQSRLSDLQGESPLVQPTVDEQAVASVVQDWTGIPVGRIVKNEVENLLRLSEILGERIIGQQHALEMISRRVQTSRANLDNPKKPVGVFLLAGTSGVGKTETALALAEALYGGEQNIITINMSEFQEAHTVSTLKGAPPGYVGYGEGGVLTEAVRRRPYSVVLLDEVEKAHSDVHEIFFQVFDKGEMEDGEGRMIDFRNTLILLTTNAGTELIKGMCSDPELIPSPEGIAKALHKPLLDVFPAALLGRLVTIPYYPLSDEVIAIITRLQLERIEERIRNNHDIPFSYNDAVVELIASRCTELDSGGRMIDSILTNTLLPAISESILNHTLKDKALLGIEVGVENGEFCYRYKE